MRAQKAAGGPRPVFAPTEHLQSHAGLNVAAEHLLPKFVEARLMIWIDRREPGAAGAQALEAVVLRTLHRHHLHPLFDQRDERQEQLAIEAVRVERVGGAV